MLFIFDMSVAVCLSEALQCYKCTYISLGNYGVNCADPFDKDKASMIEKDTCNGQCVVSNH